MIHYLVRRLTFLLLSLMSASILLFVLLRMLPGDPANALLSIGATPEQIAAAQHKVGTDLPLFQQFGKWIWQILTFNLGNSLITGASVGSEIASRLSVTVPLTLAAFLLAQLFAIPLGFLAASRARSWYGSLVNAASQIGIALPIFWVGVLLITVFSLHLSILPAGGFPTNGWGDLPSAAKSLVLPVLSIALVMASSLIRYVRSATLDVISSDYIRTARALGSTFPQAMRRHGLRNAAAPVVSILAIELATTFIGAVVVESVFTLPGLGSFLVRGIEQHDYPVIQGVLFFTTLIVLLVGFLGDLIQHFLDPRLGASLARKSG